jgi:hypothetical protein
VKNKNEEVYMKNNNETGQMPLNRGESVSRNNQMTTPEMSAAEFAEIQM